MRIISIVTLLVLCFTTSGKAQNGRSMKWSADGNSYFTTDNGDIVRIQLPAFTKTTWVSQKKLIPEGDKKPLTIRNFTVSANEQCLLIYTNSQKVWRQDTRGDYWVLQLSSGRLQQLGKGQPTASLMFAKFSPDGSKVAYVSQHNLYVEDIATGKITALTKDGSLKLINGTFDWVYEEEFDCRDGFRWSPDGQHIAYWQINAQAIKNYYMLNTTDSIYSKPIAVEYPKVGEDPSACKIGVVNIATSKTIWMNIPGNAKQHYLPRMEWQSSQQLIVQQLNRKQNQCKLYLVNAASGNATNLYTETSDTWIDIESSWTTPANTDYGVGWRWISNKSAFIWQSEKDGWRHLYRINVADGKETLLTKGNYDVMSTVFVDEKNNCIYFTASPANATEQYLYKIGLDGKGDTVRTTPASFAGTHKYQIAPNGLYAQHSFSNFQTPPASEWVSLPNHIVIKTANKKPIDKEQSSVSFFQITTSDNVTMDGWMIKPTPFDSTKKYPVVFYVYSEPGATTVTNAYGQVGNYLYNGNMSADGYIQISIDGRGTPAPKGAAWRKSIYKNVGILNVHDQAMAAKKIATWPFVDANRMAVWGWSGGGSTTLNLLFQYPNLYKTGIAIAPVANRLSYDNIYEERYMGVPQDGKEHYITASAITHAKNLNGNLLLVHGTGDDNVHYQNTEMLINELVKHNKYFQLMSYPNRTHSISEGEGTNTHLSNTYTRFLQQHCPGGGK